jgi:streptogramin lyase
MSNRRLNPGRDVALIFTVLFSALTLAFLPACGAFSTRPERGLLPTAPSTAPSARNPPSASPPAELAASISLTDFTRPTGLVAAAGSLWAASFRTQQLYRIDPTTNRVAQTVDVGQRSCGSPLETFGDVLIFPCNDSSSTVVVDGRSGAVRGRISDAAVSAAAAAGSMWISNNLGTALKRVDPKTLKVQKVFRIETGEVLFDGRFIWSNAVDYHTNGRGLLVKIDPATNRVMARYQMPKMDGAFMAYGFGALWFKPITSDALYRFDPMKGMTTRTRLDGWKRLSAFGDQPVAVGAGSLWIRSSDGNVVRIDPSTRHISGRYRADPIGAGGYPLVAYGSLWITNFNTDTVWRLHIRPQE